MQVHIDPRRGSVRAVYLPNTRANLFSLRLVSFEKGQTADAPRMVADKVRIRTSNEVMGEIESSGKCYLNQELIGNYHLVYRLQLGSRLLEVEGTVDVVSSHWIPQAKENPNEDASKGNLSGFPWQRYLALRAVLANGMATTETLVRDRRVSAAGRRYVSPLGLHLDLVSNRVTICGGGLPFHRRYADDRFDTLVATRMGKMDFRVAYGFNLPQPVHAARAWIVPPHALSSDRMMAARLVTPSHHGYFLHFSPASIVLLHAVLSDDGTAIELALLETEGRSRSVKVTSCRPLVAAFRVTARVGEQVSCELQALDIIDDACSFTISPHGIAKVQLHRAPATQ
jgi:hypothetical protein